MTKRYQRGNQKPIIKGETRKWPHDTKEIIRSRKSKERQDNGNKILTRFKGETRQWPKDTKEVIRRRKSKERQDNGHKIIKR